MQQKPLVLNNGRIAQLPAGDTIAGVVVSIPEYTTDPISATAGDSWVLKTNAGAPIGLLLSLTTASPAYNLSYKTLSGAVVRTKLS